MSILLLFMSKSPAAWLNIRLTPKSDEDAPSLREQGQDQERLYTYVKAINYLLQSYQTDDVIAEASEIEALKKLPD